MRLYVWNNPYGVNYGSSFAFAIADSEEEARAAIVARNDHVYEYGQYVSRRPNFRELSGAPIRVVEIEHGASYAEIVEWSE